MMYLLMMQLLSGDVVIFPEPLPRDVCLLQILVIEDAAKKVGIFDDAGNRLDVEIVYCSPEPADEVQS